MREQKTTLLSLRNQDRKKVKVETKRVNKFVNYVPTDNIAELNQLIYARSKLVDNKVSIFQRTKK